MKPISFSQLQDIFKNEFLRLYSVRADFGDFSKEYFVTEKGTRVGGLLLRGENVLLVRQYRFLINDYSWELPGGGLHADESVEQAIVRECREEAGIICHSLKPLFSYMLGTDVSDNTVHLFYCSDFTETAGIGDGKETNARAWVLLEECMQRVVQGELKDSMTIIGLLMYYFKRKELM